MRNIIQVFIASLAKILVYRATADTTEVQSMLVGPRPLQRDIVLQRQPHVPEVGTAFPGNLTASEVRELEVEAIYRAAVDAR